MLIIFAIPWKLIFQGVLIRSQGVAKIDCDS